MSDGLTLDPKKTAILLMDFQNEVVARIPSDGTGLLERTAKVADAARRAGMQVIHVQVAFRDGYPEISPRNRGFSTLKQSGRLLQSAEGAQIHPALAPKPGDVSVYKRRISAFAGSDLEMILRAMGTETLVLAGIATSGVVLSTVRQASDLDYGLVVLEDCCADADAEVHAVLTGKLFPRQATVLKSEDFLSTLRSA